MSLVKLLQPIQPDQHCVDIFCQKWGKCRSEREWICQHSCPPESIPLCKESSCEASCITNRKDVQMVCQHIQSGDIDIFNKIMCELLVENTSSTHDFLKREIENNNIEIIRQQENSIIRGSLLALAQEATKRHSVKDKKVQVILSEIENTLCWEFGTIGASLFRQRFCNLRTEPNSNGNIDFVLFDPLPVVAMWKQNKLGVIKHKSKIQFSAFKKNISTDFSLYPAPQLCIHFLIDSKTENLIDSLAKSFLRKTSLDADQCMYEFLSETLNVMGIKLPDIQEQNNRTAAKSTQFLWRLLYQIPI